jgi:hypothetical protein
MKRISRDRSKVKHRGLEEKKIGMKGETIHRGGKNGEKGPRNQPFGLGKKKDLG